MPIEVSPSIIASGRRFAEIVHHAVDVRRASRGRRPLHATHVVIDAPGAHPRIERLHEPRVFVRSAASVQSRLCARPQARRACAGVQQTHETGPRALEVRREQQRSIGTQRAVCPCVDHNPVRIHADHRVVDTRQCFDRVGRCRQEAVDQLRLVADFASAPVNAPTNLSTLGLGDRFGNATIVARQKHRYAPIIPPF